MRVLFFLRLAFPLMIVGTSNAGLITFEGFPDSTILTDQYQSLGVTFQDAEIITAQYSLNEADFPPHSGVNVATDYGGPMLISFASPIVSFAGYFTYTTQLILQGYDNQGNPLAHEINMSKFTSNTVSSFDPALLNVPNELIQVGDGVDSFSYLTIAGDPSGFSFVVDDIAIPSPEPAGLSLLCPAALMLLILAGSFPRARRGAGLLAVGLLFAPGASAQLMSTTISPAIIDPNTPTLVAITAEFTQAPLPSTVLLQQIDADGNIINPDLGTLT